MIDLALIHPPVALPSEPSPAVALLAGALRACGLRVEVVDANVEALTHLVQGVQPSAAHDVAQARAVAQRERALDQLRGPAGYRNRDRHHAAVGTLRRLLALCATSGGQADLADFHHQQLSPLLSDHLRQAADEAEQSPFAGYFAALARRVARLQPRVVGLSVGYLNQALPAMALAAALKAVLPSHVPLVAGGALISCWAGRLSETGLAPVVDRVIFGDGVAPLARLLGAEVATPPPASTPDFGGLPWELYLAPRRVLPFSTGHGCWWSRCRFCPEAALGTPHRALHGEQLVPALRQACERSGAGLVHLSDSAVPPAALRQLRRWPGDVPWYGFARFHPDLCDEALCADLRRAGCVLLQLGLESGSPRVLRRLNKGLNLDVASRALRALHRAGIATYVYVMFGTPGEGEEDAEQTLRFVVQHAAAIRFLNVALLNLPHDTPVDPQLATWPLGEAGDLSLYLGFRHHEGWDRRQARSFMERRFARQAEVATILRRTPHVFGANHAAFFCELP